ncbi:MAG: 3-dehydroquinate synthase II [Thermoplasmata archaeon]
MNRDRVFIAPTGPDAGRREEIRERARARGFRGFVLTEDDRFEPRPSERYLRWEENRLVPLGEGAGAHEASITDVSTPLELDRVIEEARRHGVAAIRWIGDRIIPLENVVARGHGQFEVWVVTDQVSEIPAGLGALEHGADRIIVEVPDAGVLDLLEAHLEIVEPPGAQWQLVPVTGHRPAGLGDRVIIDTTSILKSSEGMLVGSAAALLLHVASEAVGSKFTRPRAFRVNAGAAHSYALMADGTTRYLSEIGPGDAVLIADPILGTFRSARVGRVKTERRPIRMVEVDHEGRTFTVFLQDAETVRLTTETGAVSTTELQSGVRVFAIPLPPARHLGQAVEETIDER